MELELQRLSGLRARGRFFGRRVSWAPERGGGLKAPAGKRNLETAPEVPPIRDFGGSDPPGSVPYRGDGW